MIKIVSKKINWINGLFGIKITMTIKIIALINYKNRK